MQANDLATRLDVAVTDLRSHAGQWKSSASSAAAEAVAVDQARAGQGQRRSASMMKFDQLKKNLHEASPLRRFHSQADTMLQDAVKVLGLEAEVRVSDYQSVVTTNVEQQNTESLPVAKAAQGSNQVAR